MTTAAKQPSEPKPAEHDQRAAAGLMVKRRSRCTDPWMPDLLVTNPTESRPTRSTGGRSRQADRRGCLADGCRSGQLARNAGGWVVRWQDMLRMAIEPRALVVIAGLPGSGKSTLLRGTEADVPVTVPRSSVLLPDPGSPA